MLRRLALLAWLAARCSWIAACSKDASDALPASAFESDDPAIAPRAAEPPASAPAPARGRPSNLRPYEPHVGLEPPRGEAQLVGDRLFVPTQDGALAVLDVADRARPQWIGRRKLGSLTWLSSLAVDGSVALVWAQGLVTDAEGARESRLVALDVADPRNVRAISEYRLPGDGQVIGRRGRLLYVVSREESCGHCPAPRATLRSLDVSNPARIVEVAALVFADSMSDQHWFRPQFAFAGTRIYAATPDAAVQGRASRVEAVDVADSRGGLTRGATLSIDGAVISPRHLDEHAGTLRVLGAPLGGAGDAPVLHSFAVASSDRIAPRGRVAVGLPQDARFVDALFAGGVAYVVSNRSASDDAGDRSTLTLVRVPARAPPVTAGSIELPRIDAIRLLGERALVVTDDERARSLELVLLDASDAMHPRRLSAARLVRYEPAAPADLVALEALAQDELVLASVYTGSPCPDDGARGVAVLLDLRADAIALRGTVPLREAVAPRVLVDRDRLLLASGSAVDAIDLADRVPKPLSFTPLTQDVSQTASVGGDVLRLTGRRLLDRVAPDRVAIPGSSRFEIPPASPAMRCVHAATLLTDRDRAYVVRNEELPGERMITRIATIDLSDSTALRLLGAAVVRETRDVPSNGGVRSGRAIVGLRSTLALYSYRSVGTGQSAKVLHSVEVVDLRDPSKPRASALELGGEPTGLIADGNIVATSHSEPARRGRVRFYLDQIDVSDPASPRRLPAVSIPGSLLAYDAARQRLLTVDYRLERQRIAHTIHLVALKSGAARIEGTATLPEGAWLLDAETDGTSVAGRLGRTGSKGGALLLVRGLDAGKLSLSVVELGVDPPPEIALASSHAFVPTAGGLVKVVDMREPSPVPRRVQLEGHYVSHVSAFANLAFVSLGTEGVQAVTLAP